MTTCNNFSKNDDDLSTYCSEQDIPDTLNLFHENPSKSFDSYLDLKTSQFHQLEEEFHRMQAEHARLTRSRPTSSTSRSSIPAF
mmetsp:Transcript_15079/g.16753  ORF Transcript_15079/g.16753 Transcript_15079/m.16753 type:complete len:84 (+) Transcript_15079:1566-1817(+)|eukprot:CAMPEP_0115036864 /NCGR_PEP_ID=MMETSP0216-20121206/42411_1 /TAXON_ID=223996 /ORGANISM="Protocruzia adherens, Strain Boccale" /LENGTH=83 /DNA_ID=CAMNT_0002416843 /DNA_START=252 /DNA_END=503 /DNA_ORIENTATION=+